MLFHFYRSPGTTVVRVYLLPLSYGCLTLGQYVLVVS